MVSNETKPQAVRVSWQRSADGSPLGKAHSIGADGVLVSASARRYVEGCIIVETLVERLEKLHDQALELGSSAHRLSGTFEPGRDGQILHTDGRSPTATKADLGHRDGPGVLCVDIDRSLHVSWLTHDEVVAGLRAAVPWLENVALMVIDSSGSCVTIDGTEVRGPGSYHVYSLVDSARAIPALLLDAHRRCFLARLGRCVVTRGGAIVERSPVDLALRTPTQPDFMVPYLGSPRLGRSRGPSFFPGVRVPVSAALLSSSEVLRAKAAVEVLREALLPERDAVIIERAAQAGVRAHAKLGGDLEQHVAVARRSYETERLGAGFVLQLSDRRCCTVAELIAKPSLAGSGWCLPDPLDPEYGESKAKLFIDRGQPVIRSFAHGGRKYILDGAAPTMSEEPAPRSVPPPTTEEVLKRMREEAKGGPITRDFWRPLLWAARLEATDLDRAFEELVGLGAGKKRALANEWKSYRDQELREVGDRSGEARRALARTSGKIVIDVAQSEEHGVTAAELALVAAQDPELPLMRDANGYVRPVVDRPDWACQRDGRPIPTLAMLRSYDEAAARWLIDRHLQLEDSASGKSVRPDEFAGRLLDNPLPRAPRVRGLITHPLVRADGRLIEQPGLDTESGLYLHLVAI